MDFYELEELRNLAPKKFILAISKTFGIDQNSLERLLVDYDLEPKEAYGPKDYEPVPLKMRDIADRVGLPVKAVGRLQDIGTIGSPITCGDFEFLKSLKTMWGNLFLIRLQLAKYSRKQREEIMTRPDLPTKWERWVYKKYMKSEIRRGHGNRMINPEERIMVNDVAEDVESIFGVPNRPSTRAQIRKIREMAYNDKKAGKSPKKRF